MTSFRFSMLLAAVAGLAGAAGVALAAIAAHRVQTPGLAAAAQMLMVHAAAGLAITTIADRVERSRLWLGAAGLMLAGSVLFAGAIALPALAGAGLFPMAAPIGGSSVIVAWLAVALAALAGMRNR